MRLSKLGSKNPLFGKTHKDSTIELIKLSKLGKPLSDSTKQSIAKSKGSKIFIYQLIIKDITLNNKLVNTNDNNLNILNYNNLQYKLIKKCISYREASRFLNCSISSISRCLNLNKAYKGKYLFFKDISNSSNSATMDK